MRGLFNQINFYTRSGTVKKVIDGKMYNIDTAKCVAGWDNGLWDDDFESLSESLYLKKTGEYFLYGTGGAKSKYSERVQGNNYAGGSGIIPFTVAEAKEWVEKYCDGDKYEEIFGEVEE